MSRDSRSHQRKRGKKHGGRSLTARLVLWLLSLGVGLALVAALSLAALFLVFTNDPDLPQIESVRDYEPKTVTRVLDRRGIVIGEIFVERRTVVPLDKIPPLLVKAVVAAEDAEFFSHTGLDYTGMLRALWANLRAGRFAQGGSTITQQVVKTFFLSPERTIRRKVQEVYLAQRLETVLSKREILYLYLNQIYFGHGRYGVQEASRFYFAKSIEQVNLAEAAMLAGLPQGPERLSPLKHPARAKRRQAYVLREMTDGGHISRQVADRVTAEPIRVVRHKKRYVGTAPEAVDLVRKELTERYGNRLSELGARVHTTIDAKMQVAARQALQAGLRAVDARQGYRRPTKRRLRGKRLASLRSRLARKQRRFKAQATYRGVVLSVDDARKRLEVDVGPRRVTVGIVDPRYNPEGHVPSKRFARGDVISLRHLGDERFVFDPGPQGALIAVHPQNGQVLAVVGGYDFHAGDFNRALRASRQPGSSFKPFVYGAALDSGRYTPATIVEDAPAVFKGWNPRNFDGHHRGPVRLREALAHSINTVAVRLIDDVGVQPVRELAASMGISSPLGADLSIALGSAAVRPVEMATAYAAIANGGQRVEPRFITRIDKEAVEGLPPHQVLRPEVAYVLANMMQSVVQEGTGRRARRLRRPVAGKTGTTNEQKDAWFVGFTPQLVTAVWVGFDQPRSIGRRETGGRAALPIWVQFMRQALRGKPKLPFRQPPGVTVESIDPETGLVAVPGAANAISEVFVSGTEPQQQAPTVDEVDPSTILMGPSVP